MPLARYPNEKSFLDSFLTEGKEYDDYDLELEKLLVLDLKAPEKFYSTLEPVPNVEKALKTEVFY